MGTSQNRNAPSSFVLVGKEGLGAFSYGTPILRHSHICNSKIPPATPQGGWKAFNQNCSLSSWPGAHCWQVDERVPASWFSFANPASVYFWLTVMTKIVRRLRNAIQLPCSHVDVASASAIASWLCDRASTEEGRSGCSARWRSAVLRCRWLL